MTASQDPRCGGELTAEQRRATLERRLQAILGRLDAAASADVGPLRSHESRESPSWPLRLRKGGRGWLIALPADPCEKECGEAILEGILAQALRLLDRYRPGAGVAEDPPAP